MGGETQQSKKTQKTHFARGKKDNKKPTLLEEKKTTKNPLEIQEGFCYNNSKALFNEACYGYVIVNVDVGNITVAVLI